MIFSVLIIDFALPLLRLAKRALRMFLWCNQKIKTLKSLAYPQWFAYNNCMQSAKRGFAVIALVMLLVGTTGSIQYQTPEGRFFPETGKWLTGEFLAFYLAAPNPTTLFGAPITSVFENPMKPGTTIQYFHKARFEYNLAAPPGKRVSLAPLGFLLHDVDRGGTPADVPTNTGACRIFASTNLPVCYAFLQFYDANRGEVYFGSPISEMKVINGRLVQYFERALMEWIPEQAPGMRVKLADLGRMDFDLRIGKQVLLDEKDNPPIIQNELIELRANAFVARALARPNEQQQVFVIVQDQSKQAVEGANVIITVLRPDGKVENYRPPATNRYGLTETTFRVSYGLPNQLSRVDVQVEIMNGAKTNTDTWFRIWW
jgi:hypothetical protein